MSTSLSTPKRSPRRSTPKRSPLQERSSSQKNEAAARLHKDSRQELSNTDVFTTTPFPTKPQHILLPSTIRNKQRGRQNVENELPSFLVNTTASEAYSSSLNLSAVSQDGRKNRRAPNLQLKRSVTALRDMYEAQAESSRPSSAVTSPVLRPTTAGLRSRSASSSEGLGGRGAWELLGLPKLSADDLAILPTLSEDDIQQIGSESSFASRMKLQEDTSSPNFWTYGTSSPRFPIYEDIMTSSDPIDGSSSSGNQLEGSSSPNLVQLGQDTSMMTDPTPTSIAPDEDSSPNVVKLGTTSPRRSSSPTPSQMSTGSRKRKRSEIDGFSHVGRTPLAMPTRRGRALSSPPVHVIQSSSNPSLQSSEIRALPSSPPVMASPRSQSQATTSPIIRVHGGRFSSDSSSVVSAHTNLQSVLSSSPGPPVQRPIVRAPDVNQFEILSMQKRKLSGPSNILPGAKARLSPVPSEADLVTQQLALEELELPGQPPRVASRAASRTSVFIEELDDDLDVDSLSHTHIHAPYTIYEDLNHSQIHMISEADRHEAADGLSALPREHSSFAAALSQARASLYGSSSSGNSFSRLDSMRSSLDNRLQNMRYFAHGRSESFMSSYRPGSSGSHISMSAMPTWARRYYSGFYQDSFHYLYQSSSNLSYSVKQIIPPPRRSSLLAPCRSCISTSVRSSMEPSPRRSYSQSLRSSIRPFMPSMLLPPMQSSRSRMDVRKSHNTAGVGPLVSHPVRPQSLVLSRTTSSYQNAKALRHVSLPISAADPRWHWKGITITPEIMESQSRRPSQEYQRGHALSESPYGHGSPPQRTFKPPLSRLLTPRLHRDRRLHTGSTNSAGFGAPYNNKSRWQPSPDLVDHVGQPSWFKVDLRDVQVLCFMSGFLFPFTWFVAAFLPLPERPATYYDIEKAEFDNQTGQHSTRPSIGDWDQMDVVARLRLERHLRGLEEVKWQNARWWRRMNRWMCVVGLVVLVIVITLAVIGTKGHWASGKST